MDTPKNEGSYLCRMDNCYIKMCYYTGTEWLDMWETTLKGEVIRWMEIPKELTQRNIKELQTITSHISDSELKSQVERYAKQRAIEELEKVRDTFNLIDTNYKCWDKVNDRIEELKQER